MKRASATNRDFHTVLAEVELRVRVQLAGILAKTIDPVLAGLKNLVIDRRRGLSRRAGDWRKLGSRNACINFIVLAFTSARERRKPVLCADTRWKYMYGAFRIFFLLE
ncbi:hypothetical protein NC653_023076 [Populus alba x Populus x berolinensis]|uniref:Uncharacterized protein n=1 Tax=Populus alba x Populus x berolinensis TaxID=444605 RepID=A0AAD6MGL6_9ROSI|nr:hypothetical protein NC653_023076 [Populus alba x Populus x berolinensis]